METDDKDAPRYHYCVLYTQVLKQWKVYDLVKRTLPEGRGTVFYPCAELWWNNAVGTVIKPLFPGYIFIRSDMDRREIHDIIRRRRGDIFSFVKELRLTEGDLSTGDVETWLDLSDDEADFLDFMLNFKFRDGVDRQIYMEGEADDPSDEAGARGRRKQRKLLKSPEEGVIRMSYGYSEDGRYIVMEGPLKGHEDWIVDVDKRKRKAYLDLKIGGHIAKAGLEILGKKYWFPNDRYASVVLDDGTEIDPKEVARNMMARK